jgi:curved DNA-binding protein CbpA
VHDYFEILGVSPDARAPEIRRARRRRTSTSHPDVQDGERPCGLSRAPFTAPAPDAAIDFVEMAPLVDRMRAAFFIEP